MPYLPYLVWSLLVGGGVYAYKKVSDETQETLSGVGSVLDSSKAHVSAFRDIAIAGAVVAGLAVVAYYGAPLLKK